MIQQKVRKKKRPFVMLILSTASHRTKKNVFIKKLTYVNVRQLWRVNVIFVNFPVMTNCGLNFNTFQSMIPVWLLK